MKSILQHLRNIDRMSEHEKTAAVKAEIDNPSTSYDRRHFLRNTALGGITLTGAFMGLSIEDTLAHTTANVRRASSPSDLKITDMRYVEVQLVNGATNGRNAIIRIDTNQGIYGLGEVRDGADPRYALFLKSRLLGRNPCDVEMIFKAIKQFGYHGRQAGGVCAVEMALWDLCGKAYNVPAWQLLGGKYRDQIRLYGHTPDSSRTLSMTDETKQIIKDRVEVLGFTWLKFHPGIGIYNKIPGTTVNSVIKSPGSNERGQFSQIQITEKGLDLIAQYVDGIRQLIGYDIPLGADHVGSFDMNNSIRLANALEPYRLAWLEDMIPWDSTEQWKIITDSIETPTLTGEDIYLKEEFIKLCDMHAVDIVQPDLASSGGLLETKKIGDYAEEKDTSMALHFAGTPISFMANVHCAAATQNVLALEMPPQVIESDWWPNLVKTISGQPLYENGFANVPINAPGLGIELNEDEIKKHLHPEDTSYFAPTPQWNEARSHDRLFS